ncbi:hypothetical protein ZOSMA_156G00460 [Zostera marina]|uniref:Uncharacterized protein n=1 Tax=Zostera marina TaxID=29655 RepID=A0A0K9PXN1_ZOSMR|nr:hypothetical protein ZOSMA_156G00460 [Zostera marina]
MGSCFSSSSSSCCVGKKSASKDMMDKKSSPPHPPPPPTTTTGMNGAGIDPLDVEQTVDSDTGSKEEYFFDTKVYMDSDDDDFFSVNGDYTPLGGSTPNNQVVINPIKPTTSRLNKTLINNVQLPPFQNPSPFLSPRKKFSEFLSEASDEKEAVEEEARNGILNGISSGEEARNGNLNGTSSGEEARKSKKSSRKTVNCCLPMLSKKKTLDSTNPQRVELSK